MLRHHQSTDRTSPSAMSREIRRRSTKFSSTWTFWTCSRLAAAPLGDRAIRSNVSRWPCDIDYATGPRGGWSLSVQPA